MLPSLDKILKPKLDAEAKQKAIDSIRQSTHGKLKYNLASSLEKAVHVSSVNQLKTNRIELNSFCVGKNQTLNDYQKVDESQADENGERTIVHASDRILDTLVVFKTKPNNYLKELSEADLKLLQNKHNEHRLMFEQFNKSPTKQSIKQQNKNELKENLEIKSSGTETFDGLTEPDANVQTNDMINNEFDLIDTKLRKYLDLFKTYTSETIDDKNLMDQCAATIKTIENNSVKDQLRLLMKLSNESYNKNALNLLSSQKVLLETVKMTSESICKHLNANLIKNMDELQLKLSQYLNVFKSYLNILVADEDVDKLNGFIRQLISKLDLLKTLKETNLKCEADGYFDQFQRIKIKIKEMHMEREQFYLVIKEYEIKVNEFMRKAAELKTQKPVENLKPVEPQQLSLVAPTNSHTDNLLKASAEVPTESIANRHQEVPRNEEIKSGRIMNGISDHASIVYKRLRDLLSTLHKEFDQVFNESGQQMKAYKFDLQKAINFPLNSLLNDETNSENKRNFHDKIKTLVRLLAGQTCVITSTLTVNPTKHPKGIEFCMEYLASKIIIKGEESVSSRPETSFQYAQLCSILTKEFGAKFQDILLAQFYEKCPYTVPYYMKKEKTQSVEDYFRQIGYKVDETGVEEDDNYFKRMNGILMLYFTLLLLPEYQANGGIDLAWTWLSDVLNMKPRANITTIMLTVFFKCCGYKFQRMYMKQFIKIVDFCMNFYLPMVYKLGDSQNKANTGRLELILNEYKRNGSFTEWKK